ncbi:MAG: hypothetical protein PUE67_04310 [Oscillospiraceae bacterium]|nr:hypothetical protein [Oscillospiraceae bacterium]
MKFKNIKKVMAGTVAGALMISAAACTPISTKAEWAYKDGDNEKAIGVYIYAMYNAYNQAKTFAEKADGYKENESFLDLKIKDDDGKEAVASDWIKEKADLTVRQSLFIDKAVDERNATVDEASYKDQATQDWELGYMYSYYSQMGYGTTPEQELLEPYGISQDSYCELQYVTPAKQQKLFDLLYDKDGEKEVSDNELKKYFDDNYTYYTYFTIPLYEQTTDDAGQQTTKAYSSKKQKSLTNQADSYVKAINGGSAIDDQCEKYLKSIKSDAKASDTVQKGCELLDKDSLDASNIGEDVAKELVKLKTGEAKAVTIGEKDSKTVYVVQKLNAKDGEKEYLTKDDSTRKSVLQNMKKDEFGDYINKEAKALKCEVNSSVVDKYDPDMFWEEPEETSTTEPAQ